MELSTQIFLLAMAIGIPLVIFGLARLSNPNRRRSRRRIPDASDAGHRTPFWLLGWFWVASSVMTIVLVGVTRAALRERAYSAVMAATGLLYLAILMAFGMDLVARAVLS